jgi:hypothetical protein
LHIERRGAQRNAELAPGPGGLGRVQLDRNRREEQVGHGHGEHDDHGRHGHRRVQARGRQTVPDRGAEPVRDDRERHPGRWQARAVSHPGVAPGAVNRSPPRRGTQAGKQIEDRVPALDHGSDM